MLNAYSFVAGIDIVSCEGRVNHFHCIKNSRILWEKKVSVIICSLLSQASMSSTTGETETGKVI